MKARVSPIAASAPTARVHGLVERPQRYARISRARTRSNPRPRDRRFTQRSAMTTQSEDESVATLASIAGLEDLEHARRLLRQHGGDLEAAVNTAMGFSAPPDPSNAVGHPDPRDDGRRSAPGTRPRQRVRPLRPNPVVQLLNLPLGIVKATVGIFVKVIGNVLVGLVGRNNAARITHAATGGELDDPIESASKFKRIMRKDFGDSLPDFLELSHAAALRVASEEGKMLFVYLHSPEHPDCRAFCRDVLSHPAVTNVVINSCVAWGGDVTKTDAHRLASRLNPSTFPYVALMTSAGGGNGVLALAIEGAVEPGDLARLLAETAETHGVEMLGERMEREERETERRIRDEQDAAYRAALEADAQREREAASRAAAEEEEAARARAVEEAALAEEAAVAAEEEARLRSVEKRREEKSAVLAEEPPEGATGVCKVLVRFPDGSRQQRRFFGNDAVEDLYTWVDTLEEHTGLHYSLVSNFPRKVFSRTDDGDVTLKDGDLCPQATLMYRLDD